MLWSILVALVLISIPSAIRFGPETVKTNYVNSNEFKNEMDAFYRVLSGTVLNPIQMNEAKERLIVSQSEIEEYRHWYGSLADQVQSIRAQYEDEIMMVEEEGDTQLKEILVKERDEKIADVMQNFKDDTHVAKKILAEKIGMLQQFIASVRSQSESAFPIDYEFVD